MRDKLKRIVLVSAGVAALTGGTIAVTDAAVAKHKPKHAKKHAKKHNANKPVALTGDTKTQAEAAALAAVPDGTVEKSFEAKAGNPDAAAYVVIVEKADDSHVKVLEDASFSVIRIVEKGERKGRGPRGEELTGDTKTQAEAAALNAVPGGTVERSHTARPDNPDNAAYAVDVEKADGTHVVVLEDSSFNVVNILERPERPEGGEGEGRRGDGQCRGGRGPGGPGFRGPRPGGDDEQQEDEGADL
jgi:hypothetical protein